MRKPLAVGLIRIEPCTSLRMRSSARIALGAAAADQGYALAEVFELVGEPLRDQVSLESLTARARQSQATVLLTFGGVRGAVVAQVKSASPIATHTVIRVGDQSASRS